MTPGNIAVAEADVITGKRLAQYRSGCRHSILAFHRRTAHETAKNAGDGLYPVGGYRLFGIFDPNGLGGFGGVRSETSAFLTRNVDMGHQSTKAWGPSIYLLLTGTRSNP